MEPSIEQWQELYKEAIEFKKLKPWDWMWDSDIFGVRDPETGEIGYCCILGRAREHFGLTVYLGTEGLKAYLTIQSEGIDEKDKDSLHIQNCLAVSFGDGKLLDKADIEVIEKLGLVFEGDNDLPFFRNYQPGYYPWYLTAQEAVFLTFCLREAKRVSLRFKETPEMLAPRDGRYFVRVFRKENGVLKWEDARLEPLPLTKMVIMVQEIDGIRLGRIKSLCRKSRQIWEMDSFYAPGCIKEGNKRPYFPIVFLYVEQRSYFILNIHATTQDEYRAGFQKQFFDVLEKAEILPKELLVRKEELFLYLKPLATLFGIKLRLVKKLRAVKVAQDSMFEFFKSTNH